MKKKSVGTLVKGAVIGAGLGVLFAPKKGSETREELSKKLKELATKTVEANGGVKILGQNNQNENK